MRPFIAFGNLTITLRPRISCETSEQSMHPQKFNDKTLVSFCMLALKVAIAAFEETKTMKRIIRNTIISKELIHTHINSKFVLVTLR